MQLPVDIFGMVYIWHDSAFLFIHQFLMSNFYPPPLSINVIYDCNM